MGLTLSLLLTLVAFASVGLGLLEVALLRFAPQPVYCRLATISINCRPTKRPLN